MKPIVFYCNISKNNNMTIKIKTNKTSKHLSLLFINTTGPKGLLFMLVQLVLVGLVPRAMVLKVLFSSENISVHNISGYIICTSYSASICSSTNIIASEISSGTIIGTKSNTNN